MRVHTCPHLLVCLNACSLYVFIKLFSALQTCLGTTTCKWISQAQPIRNGVYVTWNHRTALSTRWCMIPRQTTEICRQYD